MLFRIIYLCFVAAVTFLFSDYELTQKIIYFAIFTGIVFFVDLYIIHKVDFYKILTFSILLFSFSFSFSFFINLFGMAEEISLFPEYQKIIVILGSLLVFYISLSIGFSSKYFKKDIAPEKQKTSSLDYLMDTSAIIDGRIINLAKTNILPKSLVIPQFVIRELQLIADSASSEKRQRGRLGLDNIKKMKAADDISIKITTEDNNAKDVDSKLLKMAKKHSCKIVTTDFNLVQVAKLEGASVININQISSVLKSPFNIGDKAKVFILKKGNNSGQGVGYLEDETMIVIEGGEKFINNKKNVTITYFNQSETGKIAFGKIVE